MKLKLIVRAPEGGCEERLHARVRKIEAIDDSLERALGLSGIAKRFSKVMLEDEVIQGTWEDSHVADGATVLLEVEGWAGEKAEAEARMRELSN